MIQISNLSWHTKSVQLLSDPVDELIARAYEKVSLFIYYLHFMKAIQRAWAQLGGVGGLGVLSTSKFFVQVFYNIGDSKTSYFINNNLLAGKLIIYLNIVFLSYFNLSRSVETSNAYLLKCTVYTNT